MHQLINHPKIRISLRFFLRGARVRQDGTSPVYCSLSARSYKREQLYLLFECNPANWDQKQQRAIGNNEESDQVNNKLAEARARIQKITDTLLSRGTTPTPALIKDIYLGKKELSITIKTLMEEHKNYLKLKKRSKGTLKRYASTYKKFLEYLGNMPVAHLSREYVKGYWCHLVGDLEHSNDYANKQIQACRGLLIYAIAQGYIDDNPMKHIKLEWENVMDTTSLNKDELQILKETVWSDTLQRVVDAFLFMCYTGVHIVDYQGLSSENIKRIHNHDWLIKPREKTGVSARVPLHPHVLALIAKYGSIESLPRISDQKMNQWLKVIAEKAGIDKKLTNKIGRKTFTDIALNEYRMSFESVSQMLGHTSTKYIKHYGTIKEKRILEEWKNRPEEAKEVAPAITKQGGQGGEVMDGVFKVHRRYGN